MHRKEYEPNTISYNAYERIEQLLEQSANAMTSLLQSAERGILPSTADVQSAKQVLLRIERVI